MSGGPFAASSSPTNVLIVFMRWVFQPTSTRQRPGSLTFWSLPHLCLRAAGIAMLSGRVCYAASSCLATVTLNAVTNLVPTTFSRVECDCGMGLPPDRAWTYTGSPCARLSSSSHSSADALTLTATGEPDASPGGSDPFGVGRHDLDPTACPLKNRQQPSSGPPPAQHTCADSRPAPAPPMVGDRSRPEEVVRYVHESPRRLPAGSKDRPRVASLAENHAAPFVVIVIGGPELQLKILPMRDH